MSEKSFIYTDWVDFLNLFVAFKIVLILPRENVDGREWVRGRERVRERNQPKFK